jgi:hypothetical protein
VVLKHTGTGSSLQTPLRRAAFDPWLPVHMDQKSLIHEWMAATAWCPPSHTRTAGSVTTDTENDHSSASVQPRHAPLECGPLQMHVLGAAHHWQLSPIDADLKQDRSLRQAPGFPF